MEEEVQWIEDLSPGRDVHKRGWAVLCRVLPSFLSPPSSALLPRQARLPRECPSKAILLRVLAKPTTTMATLGRSTDSSTISSPTPPTTCLPSSRPRSPTSHLLPARLETPAQLVPSAPRGAVHPLPDIIVAATLSQLSNLLPCCHLDQQPAVTHHLKPMLQLPANTSKVSTER